MTTRERKEARIARRLEWAEKRQARGESTLKHALDGLPPMGEPIKIGHHSEKRHRKAFVTADNKLRRGCEDLKMAEHHQSRACGIADQLDRSIYTDDHDALDKMRERIAELEAKRDRYKAQNAAVRKIKDKTREGLAKGLAALVESGAFTVAEAKDLVFSCQCQGAGIVKGWPTYALSNLSGNIARNRKRLPELERRAADRERVLAALAEEDAYEAYGAPPLV